MRTLLLWTCMLATTTAVASEQTILLSGMRVSVWSTGGSSGGRQPVIVFSHGYHGCATQSRFLMEALASAGYLIFAANHHDALCDGGEGRLIDFSSAPFRKPEVWDDQTYKDRADDIRRLIAAIAVDDRFRNRVDLSRLGLAGHSLGGYTVLGLAGAWPSWKLQGVKAVLALSPYSQPYILHRTLTDLAVPVMYQGGTRDAGVTPTIDRAGGAFDQSSSPKYFVEFDGATHFAWTNIGTAARAQIVAYSLAFMNRYVRGVDTQHALTRSVPGVSQLRYLTETGESSTAHAGR
jgi:predicted dienelactone hydrolase